MKGMTTNTSLRQINFTGLRPEYVAFKYILKFEVKATKVPIMTGSLSIFVMKTIFDN